MQLKNLNTNVLGKNCIHHKSIDSTQLEAWRLIENNKKEDFRSKLNSFINGTIIIADNQTNGIGTHGRTWYTECSNDIAFSVVLNIDCHINKIENITVRTAEILTGIFKEKYKIDLEIKEPNDIVFKNKKIGGILLQTKVNLEKVNWMVVGIGINTNTEHFRDEILEIATSIKKEFNIEINNLDIITEFCNKFEEELNMRKIEIRRNI